MGIGTKIRRLRHLNSKMSQEELAYKLDLAQTTISNIESNKVNPDFSTILKICAIFDVGLDYFTENVTDMYSLKKNENNTILEVFLEKILYRLEQLEIDVSELKK